MGAPRQVNGPMNDWKPYTHTRGTLGAVAMAHLVLGPVSPYATVAAIWHSQRRPFNLSCMRLVLHHIHVLRTSRNLGVFNVSRQKSYPAWTNHFDYNSPLDAFDYLFISLAVCLADSDLFTESQRNVVLLSNLGIAAMVFLVQCACALWGAVAVIKYYGIPWIASRFCSGVHAPMTQIILFCTKERCREVELDEMQPSRLVGFYLTTCVMTPGGRREEHSQAYIVASLLKTLTAPFAIYNSLDSRFDLLRPSPAICAKRHDAQQEPVCGYREHYSVGPHSNRSFFNVSKPVHIDPRGPWFAFDALGKQFGPVSSFFLGKTPVIVLNKAQVAWDLLEKRGEIYSSRPRQIMAHEILSGGMRGLSSPYGKYWRAWRKVQNTGMSGRASLTYREHQTLRVLHSPQKAIGGYISLPRALTANRDSIIAFQRANVPGQFLVDTWPILLWLPRWMQWFRRDAEKWKARDIKLYTSLMEEVKERMQKGTAKECMGSRSLLARDSYDVSDLELAYFLSTPFGPGIDTVSVCNPVTGCISEPTCRLFRV
ncbi:hypothetical protein NM688_g3171 [Phlebia brevispora]|uniref:Uncharacterized protein n=1 Tax=Phlebia brevispora TaxID=194682 RepID=A0ACC1T6K6_9APHY|nr:hypothetical protein NM688_g3171 [Phlebia brevispora]